MKKQLLLLLLIIPLLFACGSENQPDPGNNNNKDSINWNSAANAGSQALISSFWNINGKYFNTDNSGNTTFQYWPNAHALDVLIDAYLRTNDTYYKSYFDRWYTGVKAANGNSWNFMMIWSGML